MGERDDARREVEQKRERMSRIAHEVSRRMTPRYAKERAREMARERMWSARDRAVESSWFAPLLGAGIGALVAKTLQSRAQERSWERDRYGYPYREGSRYGVEYPRGDVEFGAAYEEEYAYAEPPPAQGAAGGEGAGARIGEKVSELGEKVSGMKDAAREKAEEMKGRLQGATTSMRERLPDRERIRASTREDTGLWALGAVALGALFGLALPETERERELLEPARRKAQELGSEVRDKALAKGAEAMEKATDQVRSAGTEPGGQRGGTAGAPPPAPLH